MPLVQPGVRMAPIVATMPQAAMYGGSTCGKAECSDGGCAELTHKARCINEWSETSGLIEAELSELVLGGYGKGGA